MKFEAHPETAISVGQQVPRPYRPNYAFEGPYIDSFHRDMGESIPEGALIDLGIVGWLQRADALKLYESCYFADGDVLELGTHRGLSTFILANALEAARRQGKIVTIDLDPALIDDARRTLTARGHADRVDYMAEDAYSACQKLIKAGRTFGFSFVDHSHAYEHMVSACKCLAALLRPGAVLVFHDYNDARNTLGRGVGESNEEYGVAAAIEDHLPKDAFEFVGVYGACGVYRRR